jgi:GNAT superfamily N-acetyltransferase
MEIRVTLDGVQWERVSELFELVGWGKRDPLNVSQAFAKSTFVRFAYDGPKLVGFGRTVDDGRYYGLVADLVVDPQYQGRGIGSAMLKQLRDEMAGFEFRTLTAAPGKSEFYVGQGWKRQSSAFIWPKDNEQAEAHS